MKESSWKECIESGWIIKVTPNKQKAISLVKVSEERIGIWPSELSEKTVNYMFEAYYSSALEIVQAIILLKGYKVTNHVSLGFFLRDILKRKDLFIVFDDLRFKRNSLVYYAELMDFDIAKEAIVRSRLLIKELKIVFKETLKEAS